MRTELERRLADAFRDEADRARLVSPERPALRLERPAAFAAPRAGRRRWWPAAAGAVALAATVLGVVVVRSQRDDPDRLGPVAPVPAPTPTSPLPSVAA